MKGISQEKQDEICRLYESGVKIAEIAKQTKTYPPNVTTILTNRLGSLPSNCKMDLDAFNERVQKIFPHLIVTEYTNINAKASFYCTKHDFEFDRFCKPVLNGADCPKCKADKKPKKKEKTPRVYKSTSFEEFLVKAKAKFGDKFQYEDYQGYMKPFKVICPKHGVQNISPVRHLVYVTGCGMCGKTVNNYDTITYIEKARSVHGDKYEYVDEYKDCREKIKILCKKHGIFEIAPYVHLLGGGCQKCTAYSSKIENEYVELFSSLGKNVEQHNKKILEGREIDLLVGAYGSGGEKNSGEKIGIEFNGLLFHREGLVEHKYKIVNTKTKNYHIEKSNLAASKGIRLYHVFENEYLEKPELVKNKLLNACGLNMGKKVNARDCVIKRISYNNTKDFLSKFHIQGYDNAPIRYGAWLDGELVGVMTFLRGKVDGEFDLNRYATNYDYHVRGLASKMLKHFEREHSPSTLKTFADIRWTPDGKNNLYTKLGFELIEKQPPVYHYYNPVLGPKLFNRVRFQKHKILKKHPEMDPKMTEEQLMICLGYDKVWDCGNWKFIKKYIY